MSDATTSPSSGEPTTPRSTTIVDTGEPFVADRKLSESKAARSKQGVDDRDPGDDGYSWVATEDDCPISGATTWVAKGGSGSDPGKIGRCQPYGTEHILGTCGELYLSAETTAEVPAADDVCCIVLPVDEVQEVNHKRSTQRCMRNTITEHPAVVNQLGPILAEQRRVGGYA